jgi:hypothetical protein
VDTNTRFVVCPEHRIQGVRLDHHTPGAGGREHVQLQLEGVLQVGGRDRGRTVLLDLDVDRGRILADRPLDQDRLEHLQALDQVIAPDLDVPATRVVPSGTVQLLASHQTSPMPKAHRERRNRAGVHDAP